MNVFGSANILLPRGGEDVDMASWAVVACDQFTSQPEYWDEVRNNVGDAPSTLRLILPEAELPASPERIAGVHATMKKYLNDGLFQEYRDAYVYVERTQLDGSVRKGLVGAVDLEEYDSGLSPASGAASQGTGRPLAIRATEGTVADRIPPRRAVREGAPLELPHVLLLCDDPGNDIIEPLARAKANLPKLYGFDLMMGGGRIEGWLVQGEETQALDARLARYVEQKAVGGLPFAVGDGNHSLATAKACYEGLKARNPGEDLSRHPARRALVELENIHDPALSFEPIHRLATGVDVEALLAGLDGLCAMEGHPVPWRAGERAGTLSLDRARGQLPLAVLQRYLDEYLSSHPGELDYIHGTDVLWRLAAQPGAIGFELPSIDKGSFFGWIAAEGTLPRKTFSMGHAQEKRYYVEARKICGQEELA